VRSAPVRVLSAAVQPSTFERPAHAPNFNFNVSHEGDFVVLASEPLCLVGVDVSAPEACRSGASRPAPELLKLFSKQLSRCEADYIRSAGCDGASLLFRACARRVSFAAAEQQSAFRKIWSLKEAFVKARGDGLGLELGRVDFALAGDVSVRLDGALLPDWSVHDDPICASSHAGYLQGVHIPDTGRQQRDGCLSLGECPSQSRFVAS
jgi:phosphopantetheinyl transferase